jgi:DNA-binding NtrC family response regulator
MLQTARAATILVVDDEPLVLSSVTSILRYAGYDVLKAASPSEALGLGLQHEEPIDLLLADVIMPGLSGPNLAEHFAVLHPEARYMFMAGLPDTPEIMERILSRGRPFLAKPFFPKTLIAKVGEVLESPRAAAATA